MDFPLMDAESMIKGSLEMWRVAFPAARAVNVSCRYNLVDSNFVHIRCNARAQLHTMNMSWCRKVSDAAFVHLHGIKDLDLQCCDQATITDAAFVHLRRIEKLDIGHYNQGTITDAAIARFAEIGMLKSSRSSDDIRRATALLRGVIPFAGGGGDYSLLSIHNGAHSIVEAILGVLTMKESNALRGVCKEFRESVMDFPWMDAETKITGSLKVWGYVHAQDCFLDHNA